MNYVKFKIFTRIISETFDYILNIIFEKIKKTDTNFRMSIGRSNCIKQVLN